MTYNVSSGALNTTLSIYFNNAGAPTNNHQEYDKESVLGCSAAQRRNDEKQKSISVRSPGENIGVLIFISSTKQEKNYRSPTRAPGKGR